MSTVKYSWQYRTLLAKGQALINVVYFFIMYDEEGYFNTNLFFSGIFFNKFPIYILVQKSPTVVIVTFIIIYIHKAPSQDNNDYVRDFCTKL